MSKYYQTSPQKYVTKVTYAPDEVVATITLLGSAADSAHGCSGPHQRPDFRSSVASTLLTSECEMPNCRAIAEGLTPALKAARTAFSLPVVNEPAACPAGVASAVGFSFARLGGSRPRRSASVVTAASRASISALSSRFSAPARSWGKKWRGGEARLPALALLCGTARGSGALAVGGAENRSGVVSAERRVGMTPTMPPASDRCNGLAAPCRFTEISYLVD